MPAIPTPPWRSRKSQPRKISLGAQPSFDPLPQPDPRTPGSFSHLDTQLAQAARRSRPGRVAKLLALGARPERAFFDGRSALAWAAFTSVLPLIRTPSGHVILSSPRVSPEDRQRKLDDAWSCLEMLVEHFHGLDELPGPNGRLALMEAAARALKPRGVHILRLLLKVSDPGALDEFGCDALMIAARARSLDAVELLLPLCDPLRRSDEGHDALAMCAGFAPRRGFGDLSSKANETLGGKAPDPWGCAKLLAPVSDLWAADVKSRDVIEWAKKEDRPGSPSEGLAAWLEGLRASLTERDALNQATAGGISSPPPPARL